VHPNFWIDEHHVRRAIEPAGKARLAEQFRFRAIERLNESCHHHSVPAFGDVLPAMGTTFGRFDYSLKLVARHRLPLP
jgi:hypothetical protein